MRATIRRTVHPLRYDCCQLAYSNVPLSPQVYHSIIICSLHCIIMLCTRNNQLYLHPRVPMPSLPKEIYSVRDEEEFRLIILQSLMVAYGLLSQCFN